MLSVMTVNGPRLSVEPVSEPGLCLFRTSFGRPLSNDPFCFGFGVVWLSRCCVPSVFCVVSICGVAGFLFFESLSDFVSWVSLGDFMNRPSGPCNPVPLFFCSCANSEIGLLMCFLCNISFSAVVTVCLVPDTAVCNLSEYALPNFGLFTLFSRIGMGSYLHLLILFSVLSEAGQRHGKLSRRNIPVGYLVLL